MDNWSKDRVILLGDAANALHYWQGKALRVLLFTAEIWILMKSGKGLKQ